jgi:ribosomal protein S18 acetylase RimI-like enzyme
MLQELHGKRARDKLRPTSSGTINSDMAAHQANTPLLTLHELTAADPPETLAQARELLLEYGRFVIAQPGAARFCFGTLEQEAAHLPHSFIDQGGGCLMAFANSQPAGFVAWRAVPEAAAHNAWELKRLWVRPSARGLALGRALTQAVLDRAVAAKRKAILLDTAPSSMSAAHRLYLEMGFEPCAPYNDNLVEGLAWLKKPL